MLGIDALGYEPAQTRAVPEGAGAAARHDPGDRPDRQRQDRVALHRPEHPQQGRHEHLDRGGSGGNQPAGRQPGERESEGRPDVRLGAARVPAPGPGRDHGRRNPRPRDGRDRHQGGADRPPGAVDAAHERRAEDADASHRHGREAVRDRHLGVADHRAAPGAQALQQLQDADRHAARSAAQGRLHRGRDRRWASRSTSRSAAAAAPTATRAAPASTR